MSYLRLVLMRHAKAEPEGGGGDHVRPLSARGMAEAAETGRRLAALLRPDLVIASDSARTRATFDKMAAVFLPAIPHRLTRAIYGVEAESILTEIRRTPQGIGSLLVIGHNPGIGDLARRLAAKGDAGALARLACGFPTSCFAILSLDAANWTAVGAPGRLDYLFPADERSRP